MNPHCLFCKIIAKDIEACIVYEDEHTLGFLDIHPRAPGHTMVVPRAHADTILELHDGAIASVFVAVKKVTLLLKQALNPDGFTIGINHGTAGGQAVDHLHIHIMPRWHTDGGTSIHSIVNNPFTEPLTVIAEKIKKIS